MYSLLGSGQRTLSVCAVLDKGISVTTRINKKNPSSLSLYYYICIWYDAFLIYFDNSCYWYLYNFDWKLYISKTPNAWWRGNCGANGLLPSQHPSLECAQRRTRVTRGRVQDLSVWRLGHHCHWLGAGAAGPRRPADRRHRTMVTLCVVILGPHYTLASRDDWFPPLVTTHLASKTVGGNVPILIYILTLTDTFPTNKWERVVKLPQRSLEIQQSSFIVQQPTDNHIF